MNTLNTVMQTSEHQSVPVKTSLVTLADSLAGLSGTVRFRTMLKLYGRAILRSNLTYQWLHLLNSHHFYSDLVRARSRFIHKPYRPYISTLLNHDARVQVIQQHYAFMLGQGLHEIIRQASREPVDLAYFTGKTGNTYGIHLCAIDPMEREGELVLQLSQNQILIYSCAFTFFRENGCMHIYIGCIQGSREENAVQLIRSSTRDLYGIRPKNLLIKLVEQLGVQFNCETLRLVANTHRVVRRSIKQGKVLSDYDALWSEIGASKRKDGDYELICKKIVPPNLTLIQSKKRSEIKKRHDNMVFIVSAIKHHLTRLRKTAMVVLPNSID